MEGRLEKKGRGLPVGRNARAHYRCEHTEWDRAGKSSCEPSWILRQESDKSCVKKEGAESWHPGGPEGRGGIETRRDGVKEPKA